MNNDFDLDKILFEFHDSQGSTAWTIRDAVEGVQIFGGIGSGKTSGSGRTLALKYLANGFGGLVLTAKRDERELWEEYCRLTNRLDDLIIIGPGSSHRFNFLDYEASQSKGDITVTANLVEVLKTVIRAGEDKSNGKGDDKFWETSLDMLVHNVIDLCLLAHGTVSVQQMYDIASTAPKNNAKQGQAPQIGRTAFQKAFEAAQKRITAQIEAWEKNLTEEQKTKLSVPELFEAEIMERFPDARLLRSIDQFFAVNYQSVGEKTRAIIEFIFTGFLFRLLQDPVHSLFCRYQSTVTPDDATAGKIIMLDLPVKLYHKTGRDCQILFKYILQRAMERRVVKGQTRPVFIWADEAQHFLHEHDATFQATARSSRIATVYLSQNLPNYYASMGGSGDHAIYRVKSFLGTLNTKIFHANPDVDTNRYAADLIGKSDRNKSSTSDTMSDTYSHTDSTSTILEDTVRPEEFGRLKTGGERNDYKVESIVHLQGDTFPNGDNHMTVEFDQHYIPKQ